MNRLARERSPYLLQHAANPVDWFPWGEEAFDRARREDKPIFLSIGYSTCHWCHVMEHESFENHAIAALLNASFVSIKVDREERPDVDRVYMSFVQSTTGSGGWPMSVFLTPDLKPFFGGTYFPPASKWGRPGFADLLGELAKVWHADRQRVEQAASELLDRLKVVTGAGAHGRGESTVAAPDALDAAVDSYRVSFDARHAGFGDAPKFPRPSELLMLLREHARQVAHGNAGHVPLQLAAETLRAMALGGVRDHIGGGFHRYSVDAAWRVPHFEKMLYDQAQLTLAYLEAAQATGDEFYATVAEDTLAYVMRDLTGPGGGFYSAEDADSVPPDQPVATNAPKSEGAFYIWSAAEIDEVTGTDAPVVRRRYGIEPDGNAPQDPQGEFKGRNLLYVAQSIEEIATRVERPRDEVSAALDRARARLFDVRSTRPRPHLDDKVLTAWNGLMIGAFARAARVRPQSATASSYLETAQRAASFIESTLWRGDDQRLLRRYRDGEAAVEGYAEDYAYLVFGLIELFQADGNPHWLEWAMTLQGIQDQLFWDAEHAGWFSTTGVDPRVLLRLKEDYDGAEPAASSIGAMNLLTLDSLIGNDDYVGRAERTLGRYGPRIGAAAKALPMMLAALASWHAEHAQVVLVGPRERDDARALAIALARHYRPFAVVVPLDPGDNKERLSRLMPFVGAMSMRDSRATAYVCRDFACREPVTDASALAREL